MIDSVETPAYRVPQPVTREPAPKRPETVVDTGSAVLQWESLAIFAVTALVFGILGYRIITVQHVVVFDALDRVARAYMVWHNDPPKLAAIGFLFPPMTTFVFLPLTAIKPIATSLIALPLTTCVFAAATLVTLNRLFARCEMPLPLRLGMLLAFAINPMFGFYAGNGMSEAVYLFFLAFGLYSFIVWFATREARFLIGCGMAFSVALLTRYGLVLWALLVAVLIGAGLIGARRSRNEVEGSVVAYLAPVIYGLTLWILFNAVIVGDPFGWLTNSSSTVAVNSAGTTPHGTVGVDDVAGRLLPLLVSVAPLAIVALVGLIVVYVLQRDDMSLWIAALLALGIVIMAANALIHNDEGRLLLRDTMAITLTGVIGAAWLYRVLEPFRVFVWVGAMVLLLVSLPLTWDRMKKYPFQNEEQAFTRALSTGNSQEGTSSIGGFNVGIGPERQMAAYIKRHIHGKNAILTDNAQTFGVILLDGRPQDFFDRVDKGDSRWREVLRDPYGRVRFMLVASQSADDQIRRSYASTLSTGGRGLKPVFRTERYVLLSVARRSSGGIAAAGTTTSAQAFGAQTGAGSVPATTQPAQPSATRTTSTQRTAP